MTSQPGEQKVVIHILPNILKSWHSDNEIWSVKRTYHVKQSS